MLGQRSHAMRVSAGDALSVWIHAMVANANWFIMDYVDIKTYKHRYIYMCVCAYAYAYAIVCVCIHACTDVTK